MRLEEVLPEARLNKKIKRKGWKQFYCLHELGHMGYEDLITPDWEIEIEELKGMSLLRLENLLVEEGKFVHKNNFTADSFKEQRRCLAFAIKDLMKEFEEELGK